MPVAAATMNARRESMGVAITGNPVQDVLLVKVIEYQSSSVFVESYRSQTRESIILDSAQTLA